MASLLCVRCGVITLKINIWHLLSTYSGAAQGYPLRKHGLASSSQQSWEVGAVSGPILQRGKVRLTDVQYSSHPHSPWEAAEAVMSTVWLHV